MSGVDRVGRLVAEEVFDDTSAARQAVLRTRFVEAARRRPGGRRSAAWTAAFATAAVMALLILVWGRVTGAPEQAHLSFVVGQQAKPGEIGAYYAAPASAELPLIFSDGSRVAVHPTSGVRVSRSDAEHTVVLLERGSARLRVVPREGRSWQVGAGPYTVQVTGTEFTVAWDNVRGRLEVQMHSGSVLVVGPGIETGARVSGTERFVSQSISRIEPEAARLTPLDGEGLEEGSDAGSSPTNRLTPAPGGQGDVAASPPSEEAAPPKERELSWSELATKGSYDRILERAEARGFGTTLAHGSATELNALADAARYRGRSELAKQAFGALRDRFPATGRATSAAFILGRMEDEAGRPVAALKWYETYLAEGGPLRDEALGRKMIALQRLGDGERARGAAHEYLELFPEGAYARHARKIAR